MSLTNRGGWVRFKTLGHKGKRKDKKKADSIIQPSSLVSKERKRYELG